MSDTPRTDSEWVWARDMGDDSGPPHEKMVSVEFAEKLEQEHARMRTALEGIRDKAVDHPLCDPALFESRDIDSLAEIGGDVCDWTLVAIMADEALEGGKP